MQICSHLTPLTRPLLSARPVPEQIRLQSAWQHPAQPGRRCRWRTRAATPSPEDLQRLAEQAEEDPAMKQQMEQMQQMMSDPAAQAQLQQTMAAMQTPDMQRRMASLREDPEIMEIMRTAQAGGLGGMMKLMQDQNLLAKIGARMGDMSPAESTGSAPTSLAAAQPQAAAASAATTMNQPDIVNLLDAAKYGDLEATEDLIAVRKDVNQRDAEQRTPLHYAIAYNHPAIMQELLDAGADLTALDSKGNSPLHYAAGYGRAEAAQVLLEAGCNAARPNGSGHSPFELVKMDANNPINKDSALLMSLQAVLA